MKAFSHVGKEPIFIWLKQVNKQQKIVSMTKLSWKPDFKDSFQGKPPVNLMPSEFCPVYKIFINVRHIIPVRLVQIIRYIIYATCQKGKENTTLVWVLSYITFVYTRIILSVNPFHQIAIVQRTGQMYSFVIACII